MMTLLIGFVAGFVAGGALATVVSLMVINNAVYWR